MESDPALQVIRDIRERLAFLAELSVEGVEADIADVQKVELRAESKPAKIETVPIPEIRVPEKGKEDDAEAAKRRIASLPSLSARRPVLPVEPKPEMPALIPNELPPPTETIEQIRAEIGPDCTRCKLATLGRKQVVNSTGNLNARLMFAGEAPGADEDIQGAPFVGKAGQLLTKIIEAIGLKREEVFIGNINRCRPPGNRAPEPDESAACKPFLIREIAVVRPEVIVVLGATAAQNLLETKVPIGRLRGQFHDFMGIKVMPTFHPAYLLRDPNKKREVWDDMKMVRDYLAANVSKK
jgi:DNA polymerase